MPSCMIHRAGNDLLYSCVWCIIESANLVAPASAPAKRGVPGRAMHYWESYMCLWPRVLDLSRTGGSRKPRDSGRNLCTASEKSGRCQISRQCRKHQKDGVGNLEINAKCSERCRIAPWKWFCAEYVIVIRHSWSTLGIQLRLGMSSTIISLSCIVRIEVDVVRVHELT